ncbi:putative cofD-like protein [Anaerobacterium chartisolvens]|uniref:Putative gluconeogenesis factor n=1 Tax=Anaerobacterium chartisolvens TaxID=1297424 RepID=A0A369AQI2_9FIRM|nr:YvcK family protein [Anaerobacterium chartisolvens]RCX11283.1 putative cofD-like protein [Anaerobacterium chartisolvens]
MRFIDWFRPGIRVKRWIVLGAVGVASISFGLSFLVTEIYLSAIKIILSILLIIAGCVFIFLSVKYVAKTFFHAISNSGFRISLDSDRLSNLLYEKRILIKGPKIVAIGGGTGLSTMLRGLKAYSSNITAIVTVADDGGGSGVLRQDLGMLPPGDIRNCILALADTEPIMEKLLQYRFEDGLLKGQSFGNLFLAAMDGISTSFEEAVRKMSDVLAVTGNVLPVTLQDMKLCAELEDGHIVCGESNIGRHNLSHPGDIKRVFLENEDIIPLQEALDAISEADMLILGPGSLYTSIIPNLLVNGVENAIKNSHAVKVYVCNVMTQPGETDGYSVSDHIRALERHTYEGILDYCIVNTADIPEGLRLHYANDGAETVGVDSGILNKAGIKIIGADFVSIKSNFIRHDPVKLAATIMDLVAETVLAKDKKRIIDYYYVKDRLRKLFVGS